MLGRIDRTARNQPQRPQRCSLAKLKLSVESLEDRQLMAGDLDASFGYGFGITSTDFGGYESLADMAFQDDGRIVALGTTWEGGGLSNFALARYHSNGALDTSFGGQGTEAGMTITDFGQSENDGKFVAVLPDGKILAAGCSETLGGGSNISVARYDSDGILDNSFGTNGKIEIALSDTGSLRDMVVSENEILFVASRELIRIDMGGAMDMTFGGDGRIHRDEFGLPSETTFAGTDLHDGKYVIGTYNMDSLDRILRLNFDGSGDPSFHGDGVGEIILDPTTHEVMKDIVILGDGSIAGIIAGSHGSRIFRLDANGLAMDSFSVNGIFENEGGIRLEELLLQQNGVIVAVGSYSVAPSHAAAIRLTADGMLDSTFGNQGATVFNLGIGTKASAVLGYANGKVLLGGNVNDTDDFFLARLTGSDISPQIDWSGELVGLANPPSGTWDSLTGEQFDYLQGLFSNRGDQGSGPGREPINLWEAMIVETYIPQRSNAASDAEEVDQLFGELGSDENTLTWLV